MVFKVIIAQQAVEDYRRFDRAVQATLRAAIKTYLSHQPEMTRKSRIKRLRGLRQPQFWLRVEDIRVFYDVDGKEARVEVLRILEKSHVDTYLRRSDTE